MRNNCPGCTRRLPIHNGIHMGEVEMLPCTAFESLSLEPMTTDTWHQKRERVDVPFTCAGGGQP